MRIPGKVMSIVLLAGGDAMRWGGDGADRAEHGSRRHRE